MGKTTVVIEVARLLKESGYSVGGMISREIRESGIRLGFEIVDVASSNRGWLAHVNQKIGPRVGKYTVNMQHLKKIGAQAIANALETRDVVVMDEIGPMELFSEEFKQAARTALESRKPVIAVIHWKTSYGPENMKQNDSKTFVVTPENRNDLPKIIAKTIAELPSMRGKPSGSIKNTNRM